jgi:Lrp/AsnC family transcriptional regulator for asnA, asnC and gidA
MSTSRPPTSPLDAIDAQLLALLQVDGRRPYGELGQAVGLSESATRQRINRMRAGGVLRIVAIADPLQLGRGVMATVGVRTSGDARDVASRIAEIEAVEYLILTAGSFDLFAEVVCETEDELLDVVNGGIRRVQGVIASETFMHLRTEKYVVDWGRRWADRRLEAER